jgi:hypothetical protein
MSSGSSHRPNEKPAFDDVVDLGSVPPPPDVHAARTAIASLPTTLLEELRRAKRGSSFTNEAPTRPGKDGMRLLRPLAPDVDDVPPPPPASDLESAVIAAMTKEAVTEAPPPPAQNVKTPPMPIPAPAPAIFTPPPSFITPPPVPPYFPPIAAPMVEQSPVEEPRAELRIELLVAITIVGGTGLVFALLAIANRVFFSHP